MTVQDLQFMGFGGWVDLARYVKRNDLESWEVIRMPKNRLAVNSVDFRTLSDDQCWILTIDEIKARAFDELFAALPQQVSIRIVIEAIEENRPEDAEHVRSFLSKLPTRDL